MNAPCDDYKTQVNSWFRFLSNPIRDNLFNINHLGITEGWSRCQIQGILFKVVLWITIETTSSAIFSDENNEALA